MQIRLSAHVFLTLVETVDILETPRVARALAEKGITVDVARMKAFASRLRRAIVKVAWEEKGGSSMPAFLNCIHELRADGSKPVTIRGKVKDVTKIPLIHLSMYIVDDGSGVMDPSGERGIVQRQPPHGGFEIGGEFIGVFVGQRLRDRERKVNEP